MKKITLFAFAVTALSLASCKKDHTCTCTTVDSGSGATSATKTTYYKSRKSDARQLCAQRASQTDYTAPVASTGDKTTCDFK